ncbi:ankyrin repeat domain-containing protein [Aspergillus thermomutatus]|uniref:F-box domain-containing protein n=1 Tax=Aspergillus thermomutatus TaxID=41047 RepID=A0A397HA53_ASPTH|nr:uncharacterized protein CDV56_107206 [Aspergillus thermomutatus]RHZ60005.1 hypothetical protein CDV56_107206 [Aspergillus thermomutatus]
MLLSNLPSELIIVISDFLKPRDLNALIQTARRFANLLSLLLQDRGLTDPKLEILLWAAATGNEERIRKLLARAQHKRIKIPPKIKDSMLMTAVRHKRVDLLEYLVRTVGANVSARVPYELPNSPYPLAARTALHEAVEQGSKVATRKLIELGADVNATDYNGISVLHYAVGILVYAAEEEWDTDEGDVNWTDVLRLLLKHGARTEVREPDRGQTPLLWASTDGNTEVISVLLEYGAVINATDEEGCTALHLAAASGNHEVVELLVEKGADMFAISHMADTPLDLSGSPSVWEILTKAGALTGPQLGRELEALLDERRQQR